MDGMKDIGSLYGILDTGYVAVENMLSVADELLKGGVAILQLRAKGMNAAEVLELMEQSLSVLPAKCKEYGVPFIINDFPDVALAVGADGVHIGQDDGSLEEVRSIVGSEMIVGRSTHSVSQAQGALEEGFDYIGYGPLFPTPTKEGRPGIGMENIKTVQESVGSQIPVFCIGGIVPENLELVLASGAQRVVIVSALLKAKNIEKATAEVVSQLR